MDILVTLIVGAIVGWLANTLMKSSMGLLGNIAVGIVGSLLGHFLAGVIGIAAYGAIARLVVAVIGAMILIALLRTLRR